MNGINKITTLHYVFKDGTNSRKKSASNPNFLSNGLGALNTYQGFGDEEVRGNKLLLTVGNNESQLTRNLFSFNICMNDNYRNNKVPIQKRELFE